MKKILFLFAMAVMVMTSCQSTKTAAVRKPQFSGEGSAENLSARKLWELERQADPKTGKIPFMMKEKEQAFAATLPGNYTTARSSTQQVPWQFRGPSNLGGRTRAFAIDVTNENVLYAGAVSGGLWKSIDGGNTWNRVTSVASYQGINAIAQDTRTGHTDTLYYLTGEAYGTSASGGAAFYLGNGVYKSTDGGLTWNSLASTTSNTPQTFDNVWDVTWNIVTDPSNTTQEEVYAAMYDAIYRSVNGGTSWSLVKGNAGTQSLQAYFTDVAVSPTGVVFATVSSDGTVAQKGIWRSPDGVTWTNILPPNFPAVYDRQVIGIDPNNENTVYFFGPTPGFGRVSTDFQGDTLYNSLWRYEYVSGTGAGAGGVWTDLSQNLPGNIDVFNGMNTQGGYDVVVKVKPGNPNIIFLGGTNIFRSTSGFNDSLNTTVIGGYAIGAALPFVDEYPGHHPDQHGLLFLPSNPDVMYAASDGGISRCDDNTASTVVWTDKNNSYISSQFYTVTLDMNTTSDLILGGLQDNGTYTTNSVNPLDPWVHSFDGDGSYSAIGNSTDYYFSKQQGRVYKTLLDANGNVTSYRRIDPIGATNYQFIAPFVLDPNNQNIMYLAAGEYIWRNDDLSGIPLTNEFDTISINWTQLPDTLITSGEVITAVSISTVPAHRLYYGTNRKNIYRLDNANTGTPVRTTITSNLFPASGYVSCIAVNPQNADELMVVFSNYSVYSLWHSADGGTTWAKAGGNLEANVSGTGNGPSMRWASILPLQSGGTVYFAGGSTGLYATTTLNNTSTVWIQQGVGNIGTSIVNMIAARYADGLVAVATHGNGMYSANITSLNDITSLNSTDDLETFQLFPNPAAREIAVLLPTSFNSGPLQARITDELGRNVWLSSPTPSAEGKFTVPVQTLRSGIYYLILEQNGKRLAKGFTKK
ncbi:MAG: T9SS type A sorting domain-containing protein [Bacteroidetes bacterium]|nr:T9SS type A sorting domain-containing protein [Bacteroidota bacterium]